MSLPLLDLSLFALVPSWLLCFLCNPWAFPSISCQARRAVTNAHTSFFCKWLELSFTFWGQFLLSIRFLVQNSVLFVSFITFYLGALPSGFHSFYFMRNWLSANFWGAGLCYFSLSRNFALWKLNNNVFGCWSLGLVTSGSSWVHWALRMSVPMSVIKTEILSF